MVSFRFAGGQVGNLEVVYSPGLEIDTEHYAQDDRVEITGTEGVILINRGHGQLGDVVPLQHYRDGQWTDYRDLETGWERSFVHATRHAIDALRAGTQALLSGRDAREVLRFALARRGVRAPRARRARRGTRRGRPVAGPARRRVQAVRPPGQSRAVRGGTRRRTGSGARGRLSR